MKFLILTLCTVFPTMAFASESKVDLAIKEAVANEYPSATNVDKGWVGVLATISNTAMVIQAPLAQVFGRNVRDFEVMYTTSFDVGSESMECLALIKARTKSADSYKVLVSHCGQAGEIAMFTSGPDNGPKFLKLITFGADDTVSGIVDLAIDRY